MMVNVTVLLVCSDVCVIIATYSLGVYLTTLICKLNVKDRT
jgi:hypothetical protein